MPGQYPSCLTAYPKMPPPKRPPSKEGGLLRQENSHWAFTNPDLWDSLLGSQARENQFPPKGRENRFLRGRLSLYYKKEEERSGQPVGGNPFGSAHRPTAVPTGGKVVRMQGVESVHRAGLVWGASLLALLTRMQAILSVGLTGVFWGGLLAAPGQGEVFVLQNGGRIEGQLLNPDQSPRSLYLIRTPEGAQIGLEARQVAQVLRRRPAELEYEKIKPTYPDTVEGQLALAQWCLEHNLLSQRREHLERVIQLDPNHPEARRALGYMQINGVWKTQDQLMQERGYRLYRGQWRLPQEIELLERKEAQQAAEREWFAKLKLWRGWLGTNKEEQAVRNLETIREPAAVRPLATFLQDEANPAVRKLYIETLARIHTPEAVKVLALRALEDPVEELRLTCLDYLKTEPRPDVVALFISKLKSKDNKMVRRAAVGLAAMKDPTAIAPLIDALITTHTYRIDPPGGPNAMSVTFGKGPGGSGAPGGGTGMSFGGGPKLVKIPVQNQEVLDALVKITGVNYQFNIPAWKSWYTQYRKTLQPPAADARRG